MQKVRGQHPRMASGLRSIKQNLFSALEVYWYLEIKDTPQEYIMKA